MLRQLESAKKFLIHYRRLLILVVTPLILTPMVIVNDTPELRCAYGIAIMAVFWISEVTPLAVTSLLPLLIFPFLGIVSGKEVCMQYMKDTNILLLGGLLIAVAIEQWNVHKRVALRVLLLVGAQPRRLMLGFMLVTSFISMWITNTATTAMMTPIMEAVLKQLDMQVYRDGLDEIEAEDESEDETQYRVDNVAYDVKEADVELQHFQERTIKESHTHTNLVGKTQTTMNKKKSKQEARHLQLCKAMLLCICYSANIGGTGTLTGTAPQLVLSGVAERVFPEAPSISFIYWFVYACPQMMVFMLIAWIYLQTIFLGISFKHLCFCFRLKKRNKTKGKELFAVMEQQYKDLGPITFAELSVLVCFLCLVLLWFLREPKFIPGWGDLFGKGYITDGTAAMIIAFMLFQLPSQVPDCLNFYNTKKEKLAHKTLLEWKTVETKFPWNVLFLLGAGFALADACEKSGLSVYLSCQLAGLQAINETAIVVVICTMITFLTEITSNTATATIFLPVLASLAQSIKLHPYYLMIPSTVCASFAFMLPVATPPNAIVFGTGRITVKDMARAGIGMNIIGILVVTLAINTWGSSYYGLHIFPKWAMVSNHSSHHC